MKIIVELRRALDSRAKILRWRKQGGKYASARSMPQWIREYFLVKEVPNPNVLYALEGDRDGLEQIADFARTDKDLRIVKERYSSPRQDRATLRFYRKFDSVPPRDGLLMDLTVEADIAKPRTPHKKDLSAAERDALSKLDAYGHLAYAASFGSEMDDDWEERGDLLLAADFIVFRDGRKKKVAYHVVANSESGGFIETTEEAIVPASQAPFDLVVGFADMGGDMVMTDAEWKAMEAADKRWKHDLKADLYWEGNKSDHHWD